MDERGQIIQFLLAACDQKNAVIREQAAEIEKLKADKTVVAQEAQA